MVDADEERVRLGSYCFVVHDGTIVSDDNKNITLRKQTSEVLKLLAKERGVTISKETFFDEVWADTHVTEDSLVQCIAEIRRALGKEGRHLIVTVPKVGYRLKPADPAVDDEPRFLPQRRYALAAAAAFLAIGSGIWIAKPWSRKNGREIAPPGMKTVVVRPLENLGSSEKWNRIGFGIAYDIGADLARNAQLRVIVPPPGAGSGGMEKPDYVFSGSIQEDSDRIRVNLRLVETETHAIIWADTWERSEDEFYDLHGDLSGSAGAAITSTWSSAPAVVQRRFASAKPPGSLDAYDNYLLGAFHKHAFTEEGFSTARGYLTEAVKLDPKFGRAWVGLHYLNSLQCMQAPDKAQRLKLFEQSLTAIEEAVSVTPDDPMTLVVHSVLLAEAGSLDESARMLREAVLRAPSNADLLALSAIAGAKHANLVEKADDWAKRALALNPFPPPYYGHAKGFAAIARGDAVGAWDAFRTSRFPSANIIFAAAAAAHLEDAEKIATSLKVYQEYAPTDATAEEIFALQTMKSEAFLDWVIEGAAKAGIPTETSL